MSLSQRIGWLRGGGGEYFHFVYMFFNVSVIKMNYCFHFKNNNLSNYQQNSSGNDCLVSPFGEATFGGIAFDMFKITKVKPVRLDSCGPARKWPQIRIVKELRNELLPVLKSQYNRFYWRSNGSSSQKQNKKEAMIIFVKFWGFFCF